MDLLGGIRDKVKVAFSNSIETSKFIRRHRLTQDPVIPDRYWLTGAKDRYIDADLTDPEVRESAEVLIREFRTTITVKKGRPEKDTEAVSGLFGNISVPKIDFTIKK